MNESTKGYGLIFDVDGVIADTEAVNAQASIRVFRELFEVEGVERKDFEAGLGRGAAEYVRAAARIHGVKLSDEEIEAATEARQTIFLEILEADPLPAFPGVLALMHSAMDRDDFCVAIATSSVREKSQAVLDSAGVPYSRLVYITGSDVSRKKPDPELFQKAAERLNLLPEACLVIEDAPNGVEAAQAACCKCVAVTNSVGPEKLAAAERIVDSLIELSIEDVIRIIDVS